MVGKSMIPTFMPNKYVGPDVANRLEQCLVFYKGEPGMLRITPKNGEVAIYLLPLSKTPPVLCPANSLDIDISSPELGYTNSSHPEYKNYVKRFTRSTARRGYRQGIWEGNCRVSDIEGKPTGGFSLSDEGFYRLLKNDFPKYEDALRILDDAGQVAFCPDFAAKKLRVGVTIMYFRGEDIGVFDEISGTVRCRPSPGKHIFEKIISRSGKPWSVV